MADQKESIAEVLTKELLGQKEVFALYLDDEADILESVKPFLEEMGFRPILTTDPKEALNSIRERRTSLAIIISDLRMPEMDGFAFREAVSKIAPEVPFAVLSGHIDTEIALRGVDLKICAFISKPINDVKFTETIGREALIRVREIKEERELRAGFISESENLITDGEALLLSIDENPDDVESVNRFFGIIHTLKGASSFFEPKTLHRAAHRYEDLLKKIQKKEIGVTEEVSESLFSGFDLLKELFAEFSSGVFMPRDLDTLLESMDYKAGDSKSKESASTSSANPGASENQDSAHPAQMAKSAPRKSEDVKVSTALLDEFMQLSGEVTVVRNLLNKCVRAIERQYSGDRDVAMVAELLEELHKINGGVQRKISEIRKVSVRNVIKAIPRAIRDVSKAIGKQVELKVEGDDLRVDTAVADVLNNSLLHIVKNSLDHGLESPEKRKSCGKSEKGQVTLRFFTKDEKVYVEIEDDGQGINVDAIRAKLVKNGTHTAAQAEALPLPELYAMIFASGFSTATKVTDISGRGVGMSMVKDVVDAVGGEIQIKSTPGKGSKFSIIVPVPKSVLIASCLSVRAAGMQLGLKQDDITRVLQFDEKQAKEYIRELTGARMLLFENELVPLVKLEDLLGLSSEPASNSSQTCEKIVVLHSIQSGQKIALQVDEVMDVEDTVIKGISPSLNPTGIFQGITFLDDGTLGLILNTQGVLSSVISTSSPAQKAASPNEVQSNLQGSQGKPSGIDQVALLVQLPVKGTYALRLDSIHRIEEVSLSIVKQAGQKSVIPYRGGVLEILELSGLFKAKGIKGDTKPMSNDSFQVVVVSKGDGKIGLKVDAISDTVSFTDVQTDLIDPTCAIEGHIFNQDKTVTLLSVPQAIELLTEDVTGLGNHVESMNQIAAEETLAA